LERSYLPSPWSPFLVFTLGESSSRLSFRNLGGGGSGGGFSGAAVGGGLSGFSSGIIGVWGWVWKISFRRRLYQTAAAVVVADRPFYFLPPSPGGRSEVVWGFSFSNCSIGASVKGGNGSRGIVVR